MNPIDSFRDQIAQSSLSEGTKARILGLLTLPMTTEVREQIEDLIQADIDADFSSIPGLTEEALENPELKAADEAALAELTAAEIEFAETSHVLESQSAGLESALQNLDEATAALRLAEIKARLSGG